MSPLNTRREISARPRTRPAQNQFRKQSARFDRSTTGLSSAFSLAGAAADTAASATTHQAARYRAWTTMSAIAGAGRRDKKMVQQLQNNKTKIRQSTPSFSALCRISLLARLIRPSSFSLVPLVVFVHRFTGDILLLLEPLHAHCDTRCCDIGIVHAEWPHHKSTRQRRALASLQRQKSRCVCFATSHGCSSNVTVP